MTKVLVRLINLLPDVAVGVATFAAIVSITGATLPAGTLSAILRYGYVTPDAATLMLALTFAALLSCNSAFIRYLVSEHISASPSTSNRSPDGHVH